MTKEEISTFAQFWPHYVRAHAKKGTRVLHAIGSIAVLLILAVGIVVDPWWLLLAPLVGYGFAWYGHFFVEGNRPATFGHPVWSLFADYRMLLLMLAGRMDRHLREARGTSAEPDMMTAEDL